MYSDSIKKKQQELLDVLFKKASGKNSCINKYANNQQSTDTNGFGLGLNNVNWEGMKNDAINLIKNHKLEAVGGLGGLLAGSLFGGGTSFPEKLLMAGLGAGIGGGLGHLVSKYKYN